MEQMAKEADIVYQSAPPYEVLSTKWLTFADIILLKKVEEMVEVYYNSGQFFYSMLYLQHFFETPFMLYEALARYYESRQYGGMKISRNKRYEILSEFEEDKLKERNRGVFNQILFYDYCLREKPKSRPSFAVQSRLDKQILKATYLSFGVNREEEGVHDIEQFSFDPVGTAESGTIAGKECLVLFSYEQREAMYGGAVTRQSSF